MVELIRNEYIIIAKNKGIIEPQNMTTQELTNTLTRYDSRRKVKNNSKQLLKIGLGKIAKIQSRWSFRDHLDYYGITDIENLFCNVVDNDEKFFLILS